MLASRTINNHSLLPSPALVLGGIKIQCLSAAMGAVSATRGVEFGLGNGSPLKASLASSPRGYKGRQECKRARTLTAGTFTPRWPQTPFQPVANVHLHWPQRCNATYSTDTVFSLTCTGFKKYLQRGKEDLSTSPGEPLETTAMEQDPLKGSSPCMARGFNSSHGDFHGRFPEASM